MSQAQPPADAQPSEGPLPDGARLIRFPSFSDARGTLVPFDEDRLPFAPRRIFTVEGPPGGARRGEHAHVQAEQLLYCLSGAVEVELRSAGITARLTLRPDGRGLYLAPRIWAAQDYRSPQDRLLVLCSAPYDAGSYITKAPA